MKSTSTFCNTCTVVCAQEQCISGNHTYRAETTPLHACTHHSPSANDLNFACDCSCYCSTTDGLRLYAHARICPASHAVQTRYIQCCVLVGLRAVRSSTAWLTFWNDRHAEANHNTHSNSQACNRMDSSFSCSCALVGVLAAAVMLFNTTGLNVWFCTIWILSPLLFVIACEHNCVLK